MSGVGTGVTEPGLDCGHIDSGLKEMHSRRVAQGVWRDTLSAELWFPLGSCCRGTLEDVCDAMARQPLPS